MIYVDDIEAVEENMAVDGDMSVDQVNDDATAVVSDDSDDGNVNANLQVNVSASSSATATSIASGSSSISGSVSSIML